LNAFSSHKGLMYYNFLDSCPSLRFFLNQIWYKKFEGQIRLPSQGTYKCSIAWRHIPHEKWLFHHLAPMLLIVASWCRFVQNKCTCMFYNTSIIFSHFLKWNLSMRYILVHCPEIWITFPTFSMLNLCAI
jgi:hypothetical protein